MKLGDRLDGHMVQGHVDQVGNCMKPQKRMEASYTFEYDPITKSHDWEGLP
jgi:riboflavin synthase